MGVQDLEQGSAPRSAQPPEDRLGSWKAIAAYLQRDITTVQRWERLEGMPVHRHLHAKRGSVYAFRSELDSWQQNRRAPAAAEAEVATPRAANWRIWAAGAVVLVVVIVAAWWVSKTESEAPNPLAKARITPLTDFEGLEMAAAISADGKVAAFLSDRDGTMDVWVSQIGSGEFHNLTRGLAPELLNPEVRSLAFTPDGALVTMWTRRQDGVVNISAVPTIGGTLREYRAGAVEMAWSSDARRMVFHTPDPGDPTFLVEPGQSSPRRIYVAPKGEHNHFQVWSPDDRYIYFVRGVPPEEMDIWRITSDGKALERITSHNTRVLYPTFLDARTLLYLATSEDGSGPWLYTVDVNTRQSRRISFGVEQYASIAASADRSRLVATVEHSKASLWRVPISVGIAEEAEATRVEVPTIGAFAPRMSGGVLIYVSAKNDGHALWKFENGTATELWSATQTRIVGGPSISADGKLIAFSAERAGGTKLHVLDPATSSVRMLAESFEVRGAPAWSPDGHSIIVAIAQSGQQDRVPELYRVPVNGDPPSVLVRGYSINPLWSPSGKFLVYADADAGPDTVLKAVTLDGAPYDIPAVKLPRGARRVSFVPGQNALVALQGQMRHSQFWYIDLDTGARRQLTNFSREFTTRDFDVSPDGSAIVFDRRQANSDLALIELPAPR
jgi:Tol biopolymer transport system component